MGPSRTGTPPEGHPTDPAEIETYLEYARENIERSRKLFGEGDLRYAIFSANEGLELYVKTHMLRYGIIDKPTTAGHFPYIALVRTMAEITKSSIGNNPANKSKLEEALCLLPTLEKEFNRMQKRSFQILLWKSSLNIELDDEEKKRLEKFWETVSNWGNKMIQIQGRQQHLNGQRRDKCEPGEQAEIFEAASKAAREQGSIHTGTQFLPLSGDKKTLRSSALYLGRLLAVVELFILLGVIASSSAHQQISRYPTQIDGADSGSVYVKHKDDLENLLAQIYAVTDRLLKQLKCGEPLLVQDMVDIGADMERFMRSDGWTVSMNAAAN